MKNKSRDNKNMTVVHILNSLSYGGNENLCLQIISGMPKNVQNVLINLNPSRQDMLPLFKQVMGLKIINLLYTRSRRFDLIVDLFKCFRKLHPRSIIVYSFGNLIFAGLAARLALVRTISCRAANTAPNEARLRKKWQVIILFARILRIPIYSCSLSVQNSLEKIARLPKRSSLICNGCDIDLIFKRAKISRETGKDNSIKVIGMVARLDKIKDQCTLVKAFSIVRNKIPESRLWLIGEGQERVRLEALIEQLNLKESVIFWGNRSDIPELLGQMDIFVFSTSEEEGFGIAVIEAMAAGLPIIATDVSACREVLGNGGAGLLIDENDPDMMSQSIERLLLSSEQRATWGNRAFNYAYEHYSDKDCLNKWYSILLK